MYMFPMPFEWAAWLMHACCISSLQPPSQQQQTARAMKAFLGIALLIPVLAFAAPWGKGPPVLALAAQWQVALHTHTHTLTNEAEVHSTSG